MSEPDQNDPRMPRPAPAGAAAHGTHGTDGTGAQVEAPTPDVELESSMRPVARVPGSVDPSFSHLPTGPVAAAPAEPTLPDVPQWLAPEPAAGHRGLGAWALAFAIVGLGVSLFVGWGFPISLVAIVTASLALRRPLESRGVAGWALALGILGLLYSAGWLIWAATRMELFG